MVINDFYVKFYALECLSKLYSHVPHLVQSGILSNPNTVGFLTELLLEQNERLRSDTLLFLISITESNTELQKMVVFQNVFENLYQIIDKEGGMEGDIVVQDCITLMQNLLKNNSSNLAFFRESSYIQRIPLILPEDMEYWRGQKVANTIALMGLIRCLAIPRGVHSKSNQVIMGQCGMIPQLVELSSNSKTPAILKSHVLFAIGHVVRDSSMNQAFLSQSIVQSSPPEPFLVYITQNCVGEEQDPSLRIASLHVIESYLYSNPDGQSALVSTLNLPPNLNPNEKNSSLPQSVGSIIMDGLIKIPNDEPSFIQTWATTLALAHILYKNNQCKTIALSISIDQNNPSHENYLIHLISKRFLQSITQEQKSDSQIRSCIGYLSLLCIWLHDSPVSIAKFLEQEKNLKFLVEQCHQSVSSHPIIQGLCAFLLCIIYQFSDDKISPIRLNALRSTILNRMDSDHIVNAIGRLRDIPIFRNAMPWYQVPDTFNQDIVFTLAPFYFDYQFVEFLKGNFETAQQTLVQDRCKTPSQMDIVANLKSQLIQKDEIINHLSDQVAQLEAKEQNYYFEIERLKKLLQKTGISSTNETAESTPLNISPPPTNNPQQNIQQKPATPQPEPVRVATPVSPPTVQAVNNIQPRVSTPPVASPQFTPAVPVSSASYSSPQSKSPPQPSQQYQPPQPSQSNNAPKKNNIMYL